MKNKHVPMLFSTDMVQAIMSDTKLETRRTRGLDKINANPDKWLCKEKNGLLVFTDVLTSEEILITPKIKVGDVIWVRETFFDATDFQDAPLFKDKSTIIYKADETFIGRRKWKPSLFMTKTACRNFLKVISVHVERLQDIDEQSAINEGVEIVPFSNIYYKDYRGTGYFQKAVNSYYSLWQKINGKDSHKENPFVWVYKFERTEKPLDFI